jgi:hypothetical protein
VATSASSASFTARNPSKINAQIIASAAGVVTVPSSRGIVSWLVRTTHRWLFVCVRRTLGMGGVLGNERRSLAGFTL